MSKSSLVEAPLNSWVKHWNKWTPEDELATSSGSVNKPVFDISAGVDNKPVDTSATSTESSLAGVEGEEGKNNDTCCSSCSIS